MRASNSKQQTANSKQQHHLSSLENINNFFPLPYTLLIKLLYLISFSFFLFNIICVVIIESATSTAPLPTRTIDSSIKLSSTVLLHHFVASSTPTTKSSSKYFVDQ
jgi:hypothetical protein